MFLAGLKFALGLAVGMPLLLCVAVFALIGMARFDRIVPTTGYQPPTSPNICNETPL